MVTSFNFYFDMLQQKNKGIKAFFKQHQLDLTVQSLLSLKKIVNSMFLGADF